MKKNLTREERRRKRAEYSVWAAAICFALLLAMTVLCGGAVSG